MSSSAQGFANLSGVAVEPTVEIRPSPRRGIVKIAFRLANELSGRPHGYTAGALVFLLRTAAALSSAPVGEAAEPHGVCTHAPPRPPPFPCMRWMDPGRDLRDGFRGLLFGGAPVQRVSVDGVLDRLLGARG